MEPITLKLRAYIPSGAAWAFYEFIGGWPFWKSLAKSRRKQNKMDYLEEAIKAVQSGLEMDTFEGEQSRATVSIAGALIAIAEHLTAFGTGAAMRREVDKIQIWFDEVGERFDEIEQSLRDIYVWREVMDERTDLIDEIERGLEGVKRQQTANLDAVGQAQDRLDALERDESRVEKRVSNLERGKVTIGKNGEVVEMVDGVMARRLDEIEKTLASVVVLRIGDCAGHDRRIDGLKKVIDEMDSVIRRLANRASDLEAPDAPPRVGEPESQPALREKLAEVMRQSKDLPGNHPCFLTVGLYGEEMISQEITLDDLRKMILAMNIRPGKAGGPGRPSEAEWADRLQRAHFSAATLEGRLDEAKDHLLSVLTMVEEGIIDSAGSLADINPDWHRDYETALAFVISS